MPLPFIIGAIAAAAGACGVGAGIHGGVKMKKASDTSKAAQKRNEQNVKKLEETNNSTMKTMDFLGKNEMEIISSFQRYTTAFEKIKNTPYFHEIKKDDVVISAYTPQDVKKAAVGASVLLGGLGGAALGTAGGFAAAGGTTAAVMALGTASTGTAISTLGGVAATNATLAALGGGSIAAGGGGMALGSAVLGGATLGVGLLIGGIIFSVSGSKISDKADKAWNQMLENEKKILNICDYLKDLQNIAKRFNDALLSVNNIYINHLRAFENLIIKYTRKQNIFVRLFSKKVDYNKFSDEDKQIVQNTTLLVGLLYSMCKVQLVKKDENSDENSINEINKDETNLMIDKSDKVLSQLDYVA